MGLPLTLSLAGERCLVAGDDPAAIYWVEQLRAMDAAVTRVSEAEGMSAVRPEAITVEALRAFRLVLITGESPWPADALRALAADKTLVYVAGHPELSNIEPPALLRRSAVAVGVAAEAPAPLRAALAERAAAALPAQLEDVLRWARRHEADIAGRLPDPGAQARLWADLVNGPAFEWLMSGRERQADQWLVARLNGEAPAPGEVYLIGGGPGDPDLLTLKALRLLRSADVVLYDRLVTPAIVAQARPDAEKVYVGKSRNVHPVPQHSINALLVHYARQGKRVARLKGGDPFIFGRGGEELETLMAEGIPFQVVPGITAASGCAAYAGIPLTHRDYAQSCIFVTGHRKDGKLELDYAPLVQPQQTVVFYMGLQGLEELAAGLIAHGMRADMPAALIQQGTTRNQRVLTGTIASLPALARNSGVTAPTLVIVGEVVKLRDKLAWFEEQGDAGAAFWPPAGAPER